MQITRVPCYDQAIEPTQFLCHSHTWAVDELAQSLSVVTGEATANVAMLKIDEATTTVVGLKLARLPESHRSAMMDLVKPMVNKLVQVLKGLYKLPGVQAIIEPSITPMLSRLQAFANVKAD